MMMIYWLTVLVCCFQLVHVNGGAIGKCDTFGAEALLPESECSEREKIGKPKYMLDSDPYNQDLFHNVRNLLKDGINFANAACPKPVCTPSRVAFLTGRRALQTGSKRFGSTFNSELETVPGILKRKFGYKTYAFGKVFGAPSFHYKVGRKKPERNYNTIDLCPQQFKQRGSSCSFDDSFGPGRCCCIAALGLNETFEGQSYTRKPVSGDCTYVKTINGKTRRLSYEGRPLPAEYQKCSRQPNFFNANEKNYLMYRGGENIDHSDFGIVTAGIQKMEEVAASGDPFFIAIGLFLPHLPFTAPEEYFAYFDGHDFNDDGYYSDTFRKTLPNGLRPRGDERKAYIRKLGIENKESSNGYTEKPYSNSDFRHAYYASCSFVDFNIQRVVDAINGLNKKIRDNTHIIITSDHGFQLGEYRRYGKWNVMEQNTRVPLIFVPSNNLRKQFPSIKVGTEIQSPVDQIDVFPTLLDMAGIPEEYKPFRDKETLPGVSLAPYFSSDEAWTRASSISEYQDHQGPGYGFALRSKFFKYIFFTKRSTRYLFDYRGGDYHRMVERENLIDHPGYLNVSCWFESLISSNGIYAWGNLVNKEPIDQHFPTERNPPSSLQEIYDPCENVNRVRRRKSPRRRLCQKSKQYCKYSRRRNKCFLRSRAHLCAYLNGN